METKKIFNYIIRKINRNQLLLVNKYELSIVICTIKDK